MENAWLVTEWDSITGGQPAEVLNDDIKGTDEIKLSNRLVKPSEEIERYSVNEKLNDIERSVYLLEKGMSVQKFSVVVGFPRLFHDNPVNSISMVLPKLMEAMTTEHNDFKILVAKTLMDLIEAGELQTSVIVKYIFPKVVPLAESSVPEVSATWSDFLLSVIKFLPAEIVTEKLLPESIQKTDLSQPAPIRLRACRILGACAESLPTERLTGQLLKTVWQLCQDTDYQVRSSMCFQINGIARALGNALPMDQLLNEYLQLLGDEESVVRQAALKNFVLLLSLFPKDVKRNTIVPLWKSYCIEKSESIINVLAKEFGVFMCETLDVQSDEDLASLITNFYLPLSSSSVADLRIMCAYNYPAIVKCSGAGRFEILGLKKVAETLSKDTNAEVRRTLAAGLHEVTMVLSKSAFQNMRDVFLQLLSNTEVDVFQTLMDNAGKILATFGKSEAEASKREFNGEFLLTLLKRLKDIAAARRFNWRQYNSLLLQFRHFPGLFESDPLNSHCVGYLFSILLDNAIMTTPVKSTACEVLCVFMRKLGRQEQREKICKRVLDEFQRASAYRLRLVFFDICNLVLQNFSRRYFRERFLQPFLELSKDPIPNVRLRIIRLIPLVRKMLKPSQDMPLIQKLTEILGRYALLDSDGDVTAAAIEIVLQMKERGEIPRDAITRSADMLNGVAKSDNSGTSSGSESVAGTPAVIRDFNNKLNLKEHTGSKDGISTSDNALPAASSSAFTGAVSGQGLTVPQTVESQSLKHHTPRLQYLQGLLKQPPPSKETPVPKEEEADILDQLKMEEEDRIVKEELDSEDTTKKRDVEDARNDFTRRMAEKEPKKKPKKGLTTSLPENTGLANKPYLNSPGSSLRTREGNPVASTTGSIVSTGMSLQSTQPSSGKAAGTLGTNPIPTISGKKGSSTSKYSAQSATFSSGTSSLLVSYPSSVSSSSSSSSSTQSPSLQSSLSSAAAIESSYVAQLSYLSKSDTSSQDDFILPSSNSGGGGNGIRRGKQPVSLTPLNLKSKPGPSTTPSMVTPKGGGMISPMTPHSGLTTPTGASMGLNTAANLTILRNTAANNTAAASAGKSNNNSNKSTLPQLSNGKPAPNPEPEPEPIQSSMQTSFAPPPPPDDLKHIRRRF